MDITSLLEALQDFEKRGKKDAIPLLEQFLCHIAKTGEPLLSWTEFKPYFMFKLENIMDSFHASTPEQRPVDNPNVEHVSFEEMKNRILKIVDSYNGIPFTIQRLCELLTDPKRNYSGTGKFLRGLEKNVMVVSCLCTTSEKNGSKNANKMNGVMFQGTSQYFENRTVNGPSTPKPFNRSRLALASSFSSNGLPESRDESTTENADDRISDTAFSEEEATSNFRIKNKLSEEGVEEQSDEGPEVKRPKTEEKESEHLSEESEEHQRSAASENEEMSENPDTTSEVRSPKYEMLDDTVDEDEAEIPSDINTNTEHTVENSDCADADNPVSSSDSTDCDADSSDSSRTENKPDEKD